MRGFTTTHFKHQSGGNLDTGARHGRVHATLETIAGIALDTQAPTRCGGAVGIEERGFEEHFSGLLGATGCLAAHDAADGFRRLLVGNHGNLAVEFIILAVQGQEGFACRRHAGLDVAVDLARIKDMQGPSQIVGNKVGHIDQGRDRAQANGRETAAQPIRAGPVR